MTRRFQLSFCTAFVALVVCRSVVADAYDPPANYYNSATGTGATLKSELNDIIDGHTTRSYDDLRVDLQITDADLNDPSKLRVVYNNGIAITKVTSGSIPGWDSGNTWNREHSWPQSRGVDTTSAPDGTDMFHLFSSKTSDNSTRGNLNFGGAFGSVRGVVNDGGTKYYPGNADAGMIARAQFYMAVRYDGVDSGTSNLELVAGNPADNSTTLGDLNRLIEWHFAASPDTFERKRNQIIYSNYQHNRNPFIDHPEYAWSVVMNQTNDSQLSITGGTTDANGASTRNVDLGRVFTNAAVPAAQAFTLNKAGNNGTYFEVTASGAATSSINGRLNAMRSSQTDSKSITVGLNTTTSTAGLKSGAVTIDNLDITTAGGVGRGANDANDTFNVSLAVLDHATPSFNSGDLSSELIYNFGNVAIGETVPSFSFDIYNLLATAGYTADMDFDSILPTGDTSAFSSNLAASAGSLVLGGGVGQSFMAAFAATTVGTFTATYQLNFSDEDLAGALDKSLTLTLNAISRLAGDYNNDLVVDAADYVVWRNLDGQSVDPYSSADGDGSGTIDSLDFEVWQAHFGQSASSGSALAASVPEPSALAMAALAFSAALALQTRKR